jgi:hypothetical protein
MSPPCFPPTVCDQVPSFPVIGSPRCGSPAVWYYEDTPTSAARLTGSLRSPSDTNAAPVLSLPAGQTHPTGPGDLGFGVTRTDGGWRWRHADLPGSRGILMAVRSGLGPRWDRYARPLRRTDTAPACVNNEGSRPENFRGSMSELSAWLSTLRNASHLTPRKTRFRLLACSTGWDWLPTGSRSEVSAMYSLHPFPLSRALPGAMTLFISP